MAVINSYYLYQKYEKRGNQPWIPCYPNTWSIDGDGTMPPVLKQQDDPSCYHPIYRWVQTQDTICIDTTTIEYRTTSGDPYCSGYDKYVDTTYEQSFDGGVTWEFVSSSSTLVETDSEYCGYEPTPEVQYRWTESGTTCDNANKYKRYIKQVSYDGGEAWLVVQPPQYSAGTLVESDSYDCGYRTSATTSATYCSNANQYVDVYSLVSRDYGVTWSTASTSTELIEEDVVECGFSARTISTATTCVGVDKHYLDEYQESRDTGTTWTTISSSTGSLIESNSYDCGYRTRTTTGESYCSNANEYAYTYNEVSTDYGQTWTTASTSSVLVEADSYDCGFRTGTTTSDTYCNGDDLYVDVYYRTSRDSGTTWITASTTPTLVEAGGCATPASPKFTLTLNDSSTVSAECDSTSAVTSGEVSSQYSGSVVSAVIGDCVTTIGGSAFRNCSGLTSVTIGTGVTSIGNYTFANCKSLQSITCLATTPATLGGQYTFYGTNNCPIYVPCESVSAYQTTWGGLVDASRIEGIPPCSQPTPTIDGKFQATNLDSSTFSAECDSTSAVTGEDIGNSYAGHPKIINITIGDCVTSIGDSTFWLCTTLTSVSISNSVTSIGNGTFQGCYGLTSVTIPSGVTSIGNSTFFGCYGLTSVTIPSGVTNIGQQAFYRCSGLTSVNIPNSVTTIDNYALQYCSGLTSIEIPNGVTTIGTKAFSDNVSLTSVTIGSGVTNIAGAAFQNCTSMTSITCLATTPPSLWYLNDQMVVFDNTNNCPIYVPSGSVDAYKSARGWSTYASRIQAIT